MRALGASRTSLVPGGALAGGWARDPLWKTARAVPSLDLRFADNKTLGNAVGGGSLVTFTRASSATYTDSAGVLRSAATNEPRFDHNPTTGESLGLLVEEARTNLLLQSENFGTTWSANGLLAFGSGSTLNALTAPDGQTTADLITENTSNSQHNVNQTSTTTGAKRFSVFAKQGPGARLVRLIDYNATDGAQGETYFNLSTGAVVSGPGTIQALPNGWYRCSIQSTTTVTSTYFISIATSALAFTYTGDGASGIYVWGAQLEAGAFPTSYIPTTSATVTRAADVASITGSNFSSWYNQTEGTVFTSGVCNGTNGSAFFTLEDGSLAEYIRMGPGFNLLNLVVSKTAGGQTADVYSSNSFVFGLPYRGVGAYALNNVGLSLNGTNAQVDTTVDMPNTANALRIGLGKYTTYANGTIKRLTYWPTRLSNTVLQQITQP
jgi:hypothetical protein